MAEVHKEEDAVEEDMVVLKVVVVAVSVAGMVAGMAEVAREQ